MRLLPTSTQWRNWTLPSKHGALGLLVGLIGVSIALLTYSHGFFQSAGTEARELALHRQLLDRLDIQTVEEDPYGLTAFRIAEIYDRLPEAETFLTKLKQYRIAMLDGDSRTADKVRIAYEEMLKDLVNKSEEIVNVLVGLDDENRLQFFEFHSMHWSDARVGKRNVTVVPHTIPDMVGQLRFIYCVDYLNLVEEESEDNNCEENVVNVIPRL